MLMFISSEKNWETLIKSFSKDVTYDNIMTPKNIGSHPFCGRYIFYKTTVGLNWTPSLLRVKKLTMK